MIRPERPPSDNQKRTIARLTAGLGKELDRYPRTMEEASLVIDQLIAEIRWRRQERKRQRKV